MFLNVLIFGKFRRKADDIQKSADDLLSSMSRIEQQLHVTEAHFLQRFATLSSAIIVAISCLQLFQLRHGDRLRRVW